MPLKKPVRIALTGLIISFVGLILYNLIISPTITGYAVKRYANKAGIDPADYLQQLTKSIESANMNATYCTQALKEAKGELSRLKSESMDCLKNYEKLKIQIESSKENYEKKLYEIENKLKKEKSIISTGLSGQIDEYLKKIDDLKNDYDNLAENAAMTICCKKRVDNSDIDSYEIEDDRIRCIVDGDKKIEC